MVDGLVEIGAIVDIDMAHAVQVLDDRDPCLAAHPLDQALAAARHDDVDILGQAQELTHRRALGSVDELDRIEG